MPKKRVCSLKEYHAAIEKAGGIRSLHVLSTISDPEGHYGSPRWYTEWGTEDGVFVAESDKLNGEWTYRIPLEESEQT